MMLLHIIVLLYVSFTNLATVCSKNLKLFQQEKLQKRVRMQQMPVEELINTETNTLLINKVGSGMCQPYTHKHLYNLKSISFN